MVWVIVGLLRFAIFALAFAALLGVLLFRTTAAPAKHRHMNRPTPRKCSFPGCTNQCHGGACKRHQDWVREYHTGLVWSNVKNRVFERSSRICEFCLTNKAYQCHHRTYRGFGGGEHLADLMAVCSLCHEFIHSSIAPAPSGAYTLSPYRKGDMGFSESWHLPGHWMHPDLYDEHGNRRTDNKSWHDVFQHIKAHDEAKDRELRQLLAEFRSGRFDTKSDFARARVFEGSHMSSGTILHKLRKAEDADMLREYRKECFASKEAFALWYANRHKMAADVVLRRIRKMTINERDSWEAGA